MRAERFINNKFDTVEFIKSYNSSRIKYQRTPPYKHSKIIREAKLINLAYWPALIESDRAVDPIAYRIAERILSSRHGYWGYKTRGGWDSNGVWGLSPWHIQKMWYAAGCQNNKKFRMQIKYADKLSRKDRRGIIAQKGDSLRWLEQYYIGLLWLDRNNIFLENLNLSRNVIAVLGRLSAPLRRQAINQLFDSPDNSNRIRIRDLDWVAVRKAQRQLQSGSRRVKAALVGNKAASKILFGEIKDELAIIRELTPSFPNIPIAISKRLTMGESPVEIAGGGLNKAEAHQWLIDGALWPIEEYFSLYISNLLNKSIHFRSMKVARWIEYIVKDPKRKETLSRTRIANMDGNGVREFTALDVLDEIQDEDVITGKDSVSDVLMRSSRRLGDTWMTEQMKDHRQLVAPPRWAKELPRGIRLLNTPAQLANEGMEMSHCVGGFRDAVERRQCLILAIDTGCGRRSTVELSPDFRVLQHKALKNSAPPSRNEKLITAFLNRIKKVKA